MIKAPRRMFAALALLAAIGCGDDGGSEPEGSISVSASPTLLTLAQGSSGTVTVTLTRGGGFEEAVAVSVEGVPTGVTASVSPTPLTGTATQATVTVNVANNVATGSYPMTVRASAAGIGAATTQYTLLVTAAPAGSYTLSAAAASIAPGASGTSTISIQRNNFSGSVALTLDTPPAGITGTINPASTTGNSTDLTINVPGTVAPGNYTLTVRGTATGQTDKTTTVALTVTAPANYTLSASPAALTIPPGGSSNTTVSINRTSFAGTVNLSLDAPPPGITAAFAPASTTGNTSTATINVAGTVVPGNHTLTIKGTATGIADKTTTVALTVGAAGSFTIEAAPPTMQMAPGTNQVSTITIVRSNLTADIALSLVNPPGGIVGTFSPPTLTGLELTSSLQVSVAATVAPAPHTLTVQGVAGSVTQTTTIALTVTSPASVTLSMQPAAISIPQGSSGNAVLNLNRVNFTGNVTPSYTGAPAGMTLSFNPNPITGNSAQVTVNVGASTQVGTHTVTITGAAGAAGNPTTTLAVTVTAATGGTTVNWDVCTADGVPFKFWRLSGTTWAEVTPTVVGQVTRFSFTVSSATGGVAYTYQSSALMLRTGLASSPYGTFRKATQVREQMRTMQRLANQTLPQTTTFFDTFVRFGTVVELANYASTFGCKETAARVSKTFNVSGMAAGEVGFLGYGPGSASLSSSTPSYDVLVPPGSYDWAAAFGTESGFPPTTTLSSYRVGRNETAPGGAVNINRTGATAFTAVPFTVSGTTAGSLNTFWEFIDGSRGPIVNFPIGDFFSSASSGNMLFFAPADRLPTDLTSFLVNNFLEAGTDVELRSQIRVFGAPPASATLTLPSAVPAFTATQTGGLWSVTGSIPAEYQTAVSPVSFIVEGNGGNAILQIDAMRGWLLANSMSTSYTLTQPTLPNFLSQWTPAAPFFSATVLMQGFDDFAVPTAGSVFNLGGRQIIP